MALTVGADNAALRNKTSQMSAVQRVKAGQAQAIKEGKRLGRPAGSKDKQSRRTTGYHLRYARLELRGRYGK